MVINVLLGKGTQAPNIKDKYCVCHLVRINRFPRIQHGRLFADRITRIGYRRHAAVTGREEDRPR
jgi:hypothetical protein